MVVSGVPYSAVVVRSPFSHFHLIWSLTPPFLLSGCQAPTPFGYAHEANKLISGRAVPDSSFALLAIYDHQGRRFGLTTDMSLLPLDRMKPVVASTFHGLSLTSGVTWLTWE